MPTATIKPSDAPPPTLEPTSTLTPTDTPLPTPTVMITNVVLSAENWENSGWMKISTKECHTPKTQCWKSITHQAITSIAWMEPVYIDPAWENPFLVFWSWHWVGGHNWYGINYPFGFIEIKSPNQPGWARLGQVDGLKDWYREVKIDLSEFKSQEIYIRFYCQPVNMQTSYKDYTMMPYTWIISDVSIETNRIEP